MSLLAVGMSHRTVPVSVLEHATVAPVDRPKILHELVRSDHVAEALVLSTCNRVEVYAEVDRFHGGLFDVTGVLARHAGIPVPELGEHLYVHYEDAAVQQLFRVAAGLDSMVVGESQILGQVREAYAAAVAEQTVGRTMHDVAQRALAAGKRVHAETGIDRAGASIVGVALQRASGVLGGLTARTALVVGAGSMGALAAASLRRAGVSDIVIANRTEATAVRIASSVGGRAVALDDLAAELTRADVCICCTGSVGVVVTADTVEAARATRAADTVEAAMATRPARPLVILDLAVPHDVDIAVADIAGVTYVGIDAVGERVTMLPTAEVSAAESIVAAEVRDSLAAQRAVQVGPTVAALRARATQVVDAELARLDGRLPGLDPRVRQELVRAVQRAVSTLLHAPTVRVKELAGAPGGDVYATALRELFELNPAAVDAVSSPAGTHSEPGGGLI